jgi:HAD superfamily hydrolase (TIGR01490 family)
MNLALFDLDYTLLPIDSEFEWIGFLIRTCHFDRSEGAQAHIRALQDRYEAGTLADEEYIEFVYGFLAQQPRSEVQAWHARYLEEVVRPNIRPAALDLVRHHRDLGHTCVVVTGSSRFVTEPIARALGVNVLLGTEPEENEGRFTGRIAGPPCIGEGKIVHVDRWLADQGLAWDGLAHTVFYSDSMYDLPLLSRVREPVATNPSAALEAVARERGWRILRLFEA